jgi:trans-aconitate 2-methyltransferase
LDTASWNPTQYLLFGDERLRPGFELLARIGDLPPGPIHDLGCGTGDHARAIAERWPDHAAIGLDHSRDMLKKAATQAAPANLSWHEADIAHWSATEPAALIFSNAALHWLPEHEKLFPHLLAELAPGGVLAVQMPANFREPSHRLIRETALSPRFTAKLGALAAPNGPLRDDLVAMPEFYYDLMAPRAKGGFDLWQTEYLLPLRGERPVLEWIKGSILRPALDRLDESERGEFQDELAARLGQVYPKRSDGVTLFPFRRLFFVARN